MKSQFERVDLLDAAITHQEHTAIRSESNQLAADFVIVDNGNEIDTVVTGVLAPDGVTILPALATRSIGRRRFTLLP